MAFRVVLLGLVDFWWKWFRSVWRQNALPQFGNISKMMFFSFLQVGENI